MNSGEEMTDEIPNEILELVDLTSLNSFASVFKMCEKVQTLKVPVASLCVYPKYTKFVRTYFQKFTQPKIKLSTVINFPYGISDTASIVNELNSVFFVDEIDLVFDYLAWNDGNPQKSILPIATTVKWISEQIHKPLLKVIIETSELKLEDISHVVSFILSNFPNQISFIKTSTGKSPKGGATIEAVGEIIKAIGSSMCEGTFTGGSCRTEGTFTGGSCRTEGTCGIKISGGINTVLDAAIYIDFLKYSGWDINPQTTRIGSSKILD